GGVAFGIAGHRAGQPDQHLKATGARIGRIEAQPGVEFLEAAGEQLAVVAAGEGQGGTFGLHVFAGHRRRGGEQRGQQGGGEGGRGRVLHGASSRGGGVPSRRGSIRARVASCLTKWW